MRNTTLITRDQFRRLCNKLLMDSATILTARDTSDKAMDKTSALLQALYIRLQEKLGFLDVTRTLATRGFKTYEFSYREAIYALAFEHAKEPFGYQALVNDFLAKAKG